MDSDIMKEEDCSFSQKVKNQSEMVDDIFMEDRSVSEEPAPLKLQDFSKTISFGMELKPAMARKPKDVLEEALEDTPVQP
jgi:hypothetical protein